LLTPPTSLAEDTGDNEASAAADDEASAAASAEAASAVADAAQRKQIAFQRNRNRNRIYWTFQQNRNYYKRDAVPNGIATRIAITCRRIYSRLLHQALQAPKLPATTIRVLIIAASN